LKTLLSEIDKENFNVFEKKIADETVFLVYAQAGTEWSQNNIIFRSSVWNSEGELISPSFKKFFNWDECPDIDPKPYLISSCQLIEKIDGSTLIVSKYKNNLITRTRGSIDISGCENSDEIDHFKTQYPRAFEVPEGHSYIYEWVSPKNRIVLDYKQPELFLIAVIEHSDYSMWKQEDLNELAVKLGVPRPKIFNFITMEEMLGTVKAFKGIEGICAYYNHGQNIRKIKSAEYLTLHRFKYDLSMENVLEMFLKYNQPKYNDFISKIATEFDWECTQFITGYASKICDASIEVNKIIDAMKIFADSCRNLSRKDAAAKIIAAYGKTNRSAYVFNFLDNKEISQEGLKKLYFQVLK